MSLRVVARIMGLLLVATGAAMTLPVLTSLIYGESDFQVFLACQAGALAVGGALAWLFRGRRDLSAKDGFLVVSLGWFAVGFAGAMPFYVSGAIPNFTDAFFESVSGFSTTGASVLTDIEALSHGMLLWRSEIQWLGGMGIVVLSLAILPILGSGGMQLFKWEAPGPTPDRLTPRIKETARLLWGVYVLISASEAVVLMIVGMTPFDAICHSFATMATGGFSTNNLSVAGFENPAIEIVITVFMFIAGVNFALHYAALQGRLRSYWKDQEFRMYVVVILLATSVVALANAQSSAMAAAENVRASMFQVIAIVTTTGFGTADYESWSSTSQLVLVLLMFIGGSAGSTSGGMKNVRLLLLIRHGYNELRKLLHPKGVYVIRYNEAAVPRPIVTNVLGYFLLLILTTAGATFLMTLVGLDLMSAFGSVAATLNNIGPGLGSVGPTDNFAHVPALGKWILTVCMLLGRLELFTMLVLLTPDFWRRF